MKDVRKWYSLSPTSFVLALLRTYACTEKEVLESQSYFVWTSSLTKKVSHFLQRTSLSPTSFGLALLLIGMVEKLGYKRSQSYFVWTSSLTPICSALRAINSGLSPTSFGLALLH